MHLQSIWKHSARNMDILVYMKEVFPHIYDKIFQNFSTKNLLNAGLTCKIWKELMDEIYEKKGKKNIFLYSLIMQGVPEQNLQIQMAMTQKLSLSDP